MKRKNAIKWGCALLACALLFGNVMMVPATPRVVYAEPDQNSTPDQSSILNTPTEPPADPPADTPADPPRSEERRVGKECN